MHSYGIARNLYATQEGDNFIEGESDPWYWARQPHLHSTSELIRITNKMLIQEERDEIWLAHGVPKSWFEDGKKITVKNSQTCFGPYSYNIVSNIAQNIIQADVTCLSTIKKPTLIKLKLRHPNGYDISRVVVNGKQWKNYEKDIITLTGEYQKYSVSVYYK